MTISRRTLLQGTASAALVSSFGARAQSAEFTYKYANNLPVTHPMNLRAKEAADKIKQETSGRVEIQIFPNNQLGSDTDMLSQVRSGGVEFFTLSPLILSTLVPNASISGIGFAFPNYDSGLEGDGRRARRLCARPDHQGQPRRDGQDLGQRLPPDHQLQQADPDARRSEGLQDPRAGEPALDLDVHAPSARRRPASTSPRSIPRCRPRWSTARRTRWRSSPRRSSSRCRNSLHDQPHVGRLLVPGQPPRLGAPAGGSARRSWRSTSMPPPSRSAPTWRSSMPASRTSSPPRAWQFNDPDPALFREALRKAGFYAEWKKKYGDEAWAILEKAVGSSLS